MFSFLLFDLLDINAKELIKSWIVRRVSLSLLLNELRSTWTKLFRNFSCRENLRGIAIFCACKAYFLFI